MCINLLADRLNILVLKKREEKGKDPDLKPGKWILHDRHIDNDIGSDRNRLISAHALAFYIVTWWKELEDSTLRRKRV